ncbi:MAG: T9SS type A sorting domain-containing protein [Bacteroidota bacterium]
MRKLLILSVAILLCTIFQSNAQSGVTCTLEDDMDEVVVVNLAISNEVQLGSNDCLYDVTLTISALDGMADQAVGVIVDFGSSFAFIITLPMGQASFTAINNITLPLDCGFITSIEFTVVGNPMSTCLDQAFFPVEFTRFEGKNISDNTVNLIWETASESDNKGFDVERSKDGDKWEVLDFVEGAGTTLEQQNYEWTDKAPHQKINYYRLRQIDFDGDEEYSEIIAVKMTSKNKIALSPNPASDFITLDLGEDPTTETVEIYNIQGRLVRTIPIPYGISRQNIAINGLTAGVYWVVIPSKYNRAQIKLIKQ